VENYNYLSGSRNFFTDILSTNARKTIDVKYHKYGTNYFRMRMIWWGFLSKNRLSKI
jgi:hypothetical protein